MQKAIFLDRDGTIIEDKHYLYKVADIEFLPKAILALKMFKEYGYKLYLVTNQSGIGRGLFTENDMHQVHNAIQNKLASYGVTLSGIEFCPHKPNDNCLCRKPSSLLIDRLIERDSIDRSKSYMIGDKLSDVQAAHNAKVKGVLLEKKVSSPEASFSSHPGLYDFALFLQGELKE